MKFEDLVKIDELDESFPEATHPANIKVKLWPHQLTLLNRCIQFESNSIPLHEFRYLSNLQSISENDFMKTQIGIIGDRVGSGKSFVILALVCNNDINPRENTIKSYGNNKVVLSFSEKHTNLKTNLLVIPHNLVSQWESYINAFTDNLKVMMISKTKHIEQLYDAQTNIPDYDLIVVTSTFYVRIAQHLSSRSFKMQRVIYDEVDGINLPSCISVESNFYWFVTASYGNLLYPRGYSKWDYNQARSIWYATGLRGTGFIRELFNDLHNSLSKEWVKILVVKNKDEYIEKSITLPAIQEKRILCKTPMVIDVLNGFVDREIIQFLNAGDVQSAIQRVSPSNKNTQEHLIDLQINSLVRELQNHEARLEFTNNLLFENEQEKQLEIQRITRKRDIVKEKIEGIKDRIQNTRQCCICYDSLVNKTISKCCSNSFCFVCINIWLLNKQVCPFCKKTMAPTDLLVVSSGSSSSHDACTSDNGVSSNNDKLKNLEVILKGMTSASKVLIYSSYEMSFNSIVCVLERLGLKYAFLKGPESHIRKTIERFKTENVNVLLVNTRNYGSGLNLENTTDVIMFHKVETETEKQVIGRAQRFGRTSPLVVWTLLHDNEMNSDA